MAFRILARAISGGGVCHLRGACALRGESARGLGDPPTGVGRHGGGIKGGLTYGATDDFGYHAVENRVHVRDLHATMLHLLGIDHNRFTVPYQGLDAKLTGVEPARVVSDLLA